MDIRIEPLSEETLEEASRIADQEFTDEHVVPSDSFRASLDPAWKEEYRKRVPHIDDLQYWVARDEMGKVLGVTGLYKRTDDGEEARWLGWHCVDPEARGQHIGSQLLEHAMQEARHASVKFLRLYTSEHPDEEVARHLYEKRGLTVKERIEGEQGEHATLIRELELSDSPDAKELNRHTVRVCTGEQDEAGAEKEREVVIEHILNPEDPRIEQAHSFMKSHFGESEIDSVELTRDAIKNWGYIFIIGTDETTKEIVALAAGAPLSPYDEDDEPDEEVEFMTGCYIAVEKAYRGQGLAKKFFEERMRIAQEETEGRGKKFLGYLSEGSEQEEFFNKVIAKRMYVKTQEEPPVYEEVKYFQPPTDWEEGGRGIVKKGDEEAQPFERYSAPEHLVFAPPPGESIKSIPCAQLMRMVRGMFEYNSFGNYIDVQHPEDEEGFRVCREYVRSFENELETHFAQSIDGKVHLFSGGEREQFRDQGATIVEHGAAK